MQQSARYILHAYVCDIVFSLENALLANLSNPVISINMAHIHDCQQTLLMLSSSVLLSTNLFSCHTLQFLTSHNAAKIYLSDVCDVFFVPQTHTHLKHLDVQGVFNILM